MINLAIVLVENSPKETLTCSVHDLKTLINWYIFNIFSDEF